MTVQKELIELTERQISDYESHIYTDSMSINIIKSALIGFEDCAPCVSNSNKDIRENKDNIIKNKILLGNEKRF